MLNKVMIIGRAGQDPEVRYGQSGSAILNLSIATDESYTDRDGNRQERTEWHRVVAYNRTAETCATYLRKGRLVFVEGKLQTRKWQDKQGQDRYTTEIVAQTIRFLDRRDDSEGYSENGGGQGGFRRNNQAGDRNGYGRQGQRQNSGTREHREAGGYEPGGPGMNDMDSAHSYGDYEGERRNARPQRQAAGPAETERAYPSESGESDPNEVPF